MAHDDLRGCRRHGWCVESGARSRSDSRATGFAIGVLDRDRAGARRHLRRRRRRGWSRSAVTADVTDEAQVARAFGDLKARLGLDACARQQRRLGRLRHVRGRAIPRPGRRSSTSTTAACCSARTLRSPTSPPPATRDGSSASAPTPPASGASGEAVYSGCKAAIIGFSKALARELARDLVPVNVVCPGPIDTALLKSVGASEQGAKIVAGMSKAIPFRRLGTPDEIAEAVAFFASPAAGFITGQVLSVSGGPHDGG